MRRLLPAVFFGLACAACTAPPDEEAQEPAMTPGALLFLDQCAVCHGRQGDLGLSGAKDLRGSSLGRDEMAAVISQGKGAMAGFGAKLSAQQIGQVADHVLSLRTTE
jgi:cytochrome c6